MVFFPDHAILPSVRAQATEANVQETVEALPFTPLQARIHEVDLPTFDFLVSLGVFSARELRGIHLWTVGILRIAFQWDGLWQHRT